MATKSKKTAKKETPKKKDPNKSKAAQAANKNKAKAEAKEGFKTPGKMITTLILERKYTDEEIIAKVNKAFPEKETPISYCGNHRWALNNMENYGPDLNDNPVEKLYKVDGKLVPKSEMPKKERKAKKKYTEENDPLKKVGIDVHSKKKAKKKTAKKKVATKKK